MPLTIATTRRPVPDLDYLLHKHPAKLQSFDLSFGRVHVVYPHADADRCPAGLLLDEDAVGTVRGESPDRGFLLGRSRRPAVRRAVVPGPRVRRRRAGEQ